MSPHWVLLAAVGVAAVRLRQLASRRDPDGWRLAVAGALTILAAVNLGLARAGRYSAWTAVVGVIVVAALIRIVGAWRAERPAAGPAEQPPWDELGPDGASTGGWRLGAVMVALAALYAAFPIHYLLAGTDPGVYLVFAARIARSGGLDLDLPALAAAHAQYGDLVQHRLPGTYSGLAWGEPTPGHILPQFMHLFPALAASAFGLGGLPGLVRVNVPVMLVCLWLIFGLATRLAGRRVAWWTLAALALNPVVVWNARMTQSEPLALLLGLLGLSLALRAHDRGGVRGGLVVGLVTGLGVFNRLDAAIAVLIPLGLAITADRARRRPAAWALAGHALASSLALLDGWLHSRPYLIDHWTRGVPLILALNYGAVLAGAAWLALLPRIDAERLRRQAGRAALAALALWVMVIGPLRPLWDAHPFARGLWELSWFVNPLALPLCLVGAAWALGRDDSRRWLPLLGLAGSALFVFSWRPSITWEQIWLTRRWLPQVIPLVTLLAVVGLHRAEGWLGRPRLARALARLIGVAYLGGMLLLGHGFLISTQLAGYPKAYEALVAHLASRSDRGACFTDNEQIAALLTYIHDQPTLIIPKERMDAVNAGALDGRRFIGLDPLRPPAVVDHRGALYGRFLEKVSRRPALRLRDRNYSLWTGILDHGRRPPRWPMVIPATYVGLSTDVGRRESGQLVTSGRAGFLTYGPYLTLARGRFRLTVVGQVRSASGHGEIEVTAAGGTRRLGHAPMVAGGPPSGAPIPPVEFELTEPTDHVELRIRVDAAFGFELAALRLERVR